MKSQVEIVDLDDWNYCWSGQIPRCLMPWKIYSDTAGLYNNQNYAKLCQVL